MPTPRRWLLALATAFAGAASLHGLLASQGVQYDYEAVVSTNARKQGTVRAGAVAWTCEGKTCRARGPWESPGVSACANLAREVGQNTSRTDARAGGSMRRRWRVATAPPQGMIAGARPSPGGIQAPLPGTRVSPVNPRVAAGPPRTAGSTARDFDGDGHEAVEAGGDDCDNRDPRRYPGNDEVADTAGHDEDCDLNTFGHVDRDGDGYPDARYFNRGPAGDSSRGSDCDDTTGAVHPALPEVCNLIDDDCDGQIDEGVKMRAWSDRDRDLFGDPLALQMVCPVQIGPSSSPTTSTATTRIRE